MEAQGTRVRSSAAASGAFALAWTGIGSAAALAARMAGSWAGLTGDEAVAADWAERLAYPASLREVPSGVAWFHGASVGEVRALAPLTRALATLHPDLPLLVTASTTAGRQCAGDETAGHARLAPLDATGPMQRFLAAFRPRLHVLVETEIWPTRLRLLRRAGIPAALVSARLSPERAHRYRRLAALYGPCLRGLALLAPASRADRERLIAAGADADRIGPEGNLKWDAAPPAPSPAEAEATRRTLGIDPARPWLVLGSAHPGEGRAVIDATLDALRARALPEAGTVGFLLAPRHIDRFAPELAQIEAAAAAGGPSILPVWRVSRGPAPPPARIVVLDRIGLLPRVYPFARAALLGGSLVPVGGHTPLEAAAAGCPLVAGPHLAHQVDLVEPLAAAGAVFPAADARAAGSALTALLADPPAARRAGEAGRAVVDARRGIGLRLARSLVELLA